MIAKRVCTCFRSLLAIALISLGTAMAAPDESLNSMPSLKQDVPSSKARCLTSVL